MEVIIFFRKYTFNEKSFEQKEWENLVFYFEDDKALKKYIIENWPLNSFVKGALKFFS